MINPDTLNDAAEALAGLIADAAKDAGFNVTACVTPVEPSWDCGRIHVWPAQIATQQVKCSAAPFTSLAWAVAYCIGTDEKESCEWWAENGRTSNGMKLLWGVYGGLLDRYNSGALCEALVTQCVDTTIGPITPTSAGDLVVYAGLLTFRMDLTQMP